MICKIWQWYQNLGIHAGLGAQEVRHIRALNGMIPIVTGLLWLQLPFVIQLLPATKYIFAAFILWPALMQLLPLLHRKGYYTTARIAYSISTICLITFISLQLGPETANHLFMVAAIVGFFIIFPPSQIRILVSMVLIAILAFTALEVYFSSHDGLLQLPAEFIIIARWSSISAFVTIIVAITAYHYKTVTDAERDLEMEHRRSENLLLNILPATIANRLKKQEKTIADQIGHASVLFIDLVGFTALSGRIHHQRLVEILDQLFSEIDRIVTHHGLEKIKMIGDAYMVAGGVPEPKAEHHVAIAHCALDILKYIKSKPIPEAPDLGLRMGIHCGPLVAGVICKKKFAYDLWGDTVNLASRMESHSLPNSIQVSADFYACTRHAFRYMARGPMEIKGKGSMETYLLEGRSI